MNKGDSGGQQREARDKIRSALLDESLAAILLGLKKEIKAMLEVSETNQEGIQASSSTLSQSLDEVAARSRVMEEEVVQIKQDVIAKTAGISLPTKQNQGPQEDVERIENHSQRNNLRFLNVPEADGGANMKYFIISLLQKGAL
ncbi:hypothetical protein NDU88_005267 [Pleurodeles waltl]|uniref:Uncharacterized protein n=1 Tax=Pleurodeles waltl TaxID=8319 RepID=A0AAV7RLS3_PLEWA|nr:hypothetical protein NDU88_005267 [Pleurodeles waltl]